MLTSVALALLGSKRAWQCMRGGCSCAAAFDTISIASKQDLGHRHELSVWLAGRCKANGAGADVYATMSTRRRGFSRLQILSSS